MHGIFGVCRFERRGHSHNIWGRAVTLDGSMYHSQEDELLVVYQYNDASWNYEVRAVVVDAPMISKLNQ